METGQALKDLEAYRALLQQRFALEALRAQQIQAAMAGHQHSTSVPGVAQFVAQPRPKQNVAPRPHPVKQPQPAAAAPKPSPQEDAHDDVLDIGDGLDHVYFAPVTSEGLEKRLGIKLKPHPDKVSEAAALSSVQTPLLQYSLCLPKEILLNGISALQVQAVHLACARHETFLPNGQRAGFYLGDGPGVGKGRQIAALVTENILRKRGNERAVWFSASADLAVDATRDFRDIGAYKYDPIRIHFLRRIGKIRPGLKLEDVKGLDKGVLFSTYNLLISQSTSFSKVKQQRDANPLKFNNPAADHTDIHAKKEYAEAMFGEMEFGPGSRLAQIVEWCGGASFDGALVFDECHKAKNCTAKHGERGSQMESKTSRAVIELQRRLPNARVLYVSATGATEASNLGYMQRLGLWGPGTSFVSKDEFIDLLQQQGISVMELVAMELKQAGFFLARTLSYEGVTYEQLPIQVNPEYKQLYNNSCELWLKIWDAVDKFAPDRKKGMSQMWGGHLRFFRQLLTACKIDDIEAFAKKMLAEGHCVVIGLQSTGEARTEAMVRDAGAANDENFAFDSFADPAGLIMTTIIEDHCKASPNYQYLLDRAKSLNLPTNPLDDLIDRLGGVDKVAELTGRRKRMVRDPDAGTFHYKARAQDMPLNEVNIAEKNRFQRGEKLVAIISDAASTGISLQADRSVPNQRVRVHITAELAWSADKTVQQLGRTHRSNQLQPPRYVILFTDVAGEHRFAGAVAKRLEQLGALTHGDRHAACQDALSSFNVDDKYGQAALGEMYRIFLRRSSAAAPGYAVPAWMEEQTRHLPPEQQEAARLRLFAEFIPVACDLLRKVDVITMDSKYWGKETEYRTANSHLPESEKVPTASFNKLMNRLLGVKIEYQRKIFDYFTALQEKHIRQAKREHVFEPTGIMHFSSNTDYVTHKVIWDRQDSPHQTYLYEYKMDRGVTYEEALELLKTELAENEQSRSGFYHMTHGKTGNKQYVLALECNKDGRRVTKADRGKRGTYMRLIRPNSGFTAASMAYQEFTGKYKRITDERQESAWLEKQWREEHKKDPGQKRFETNFLVTGAIMPALQPILRLYKTFPRREHLKVARVKASNGDERVGILLKEGLAPLVVRVITDAADRLRGAMTPPLPRTHCTETDHGRQLVLHKDHPESKQAPVAAASDPPVLQEVGNENVQVDMEDADFLEEPKQRKERRKGVTRRRRSKSSADRSKQESADAAVQLTAEDEEQLANCPCWESIDLPPIKEDEVKRELAAKAEPPAKAVPSAEAVPKVKAARVGRSIAARQEFASAGETSSESEPDELPGSDSEESADEGAESDVDASDCEVSAEASAKSGSAKSGKEATLSPAAESDGPCADDASETASAASDSEAEVATQAKEASRNEASSEEDEPPAKQRTGRKASKQKDGKSRKASAKKVAAEDSDAEDEPKVYTNSDISEGWVVKCTCGVTSDDGRDMIECDSCKVWQHVKCALGKKRAKALPAGQEFVCAFCRAADEDAPHSKPPQAAGSDKGNLEAPPPSGVDDGGMEADAAAEEDNSPAEETRASTPLKRKKAADGAKDEREAKKGKLGKLARKAARHAALAAREKSAAKRLSTDADADGASNAAAEAATPTKRPRTALPAAASALEDVSGGAGGSAANALAPQGKRVRVRALLSDSEDEAPVVAQRLETERSSCSAAARPAEDAEAVRELREKCSRLQGELDSQHKAQNELAASVAAEARRQAEAAVEARIEAAVAERVNGRLMESMRKARDLGRQKAADEWSQKLEKQRAESAAALAEARAAAKPQAWRAEKQELLSSQQKLAEEKKALEEKLAAALAQSSAVAETDSALADMSLRLKTAMAEKEELRAALERARAQQSESDAERTKAERIHASMRNEQAAAAQLKEEAEQHAAAAEAAAAEKEDLEARLEAEKEHAAAARSVVEADSRRLQAELAAAADARAALQAQLAALSAELLGLRSAAAANAEENGAGTPARRSSLGGSGPTSAPASLQKSAIKGAAGPPGSKRVSWDPSLWLVNSTEAEAETPASKQQRPILQTANSFDEPETPVGHEKVGTHQGKSVDQQQLLAWMRGQNKAVSFDEVAAGMGVAGKQSAALKRAMDGLLSEFEIYETGVCTGLFQVL